MGLSPAKEEKKGLPATAMRSALYYPNTEMSEALLKTSLLLWDEVHVIVPWAEFQPRYDSRDADEAFSLIGRCRLPTDREKLQVHSFVRDFAKRPLPRAFSYRATGSTIHGVYPQKMLPETWQLLEEAGLTGQTRAGVQYPMNEPTALSLMNIISDCCAGESLTRITDQADAYAGLAGLFVHELGEEEILNTGREQLVPLSLRITNAENLTFKKLIDFRKREFGTGDGHSIRDLRHRFMERIETQVTTLANAATANDVAEIRRQFEEDTTDDYSELRQALRLKAQEMLGVREIVTVIAAAGTLVAAMAGHFIPGVVAGGGGAASIGGLLATRSKFVAERREILKKHPTAYLYEASGGLRF
jgi:hypothetical protein